MGQHEHTPGPMTVRRWKDTDQDVGNVILDADGVEIAQLSYTGGDEDKMAQGMAAWPDLADVLQEALDALAAGKGVIHGSLRPDAGLAFDAARRIEEKARKALRTAGRLA